MPLPSASRETTRSSRVETGLRHDGVDDREVGDGRRVERSRVGAGAGHPCQHGRVFIDVPDGKHPVMYVWGELVPGIGPAAAAFSQAVYERSTLGLPEFEAARHAHRADQRVHLLPGLADRARRRRRSRRASTSRWPSGAPPIALDERARLAAEYAERYALDHHGIDDDLWTRLRAVYEDRELVELSMCLGCWLGFGRLNRVFGLDTACMLPSHIDSTSGAR